MWTFQLPSRLHFPSFIFNIIFFRKYYLTARIQTMCRSFRLLAFGFSVKWIYISFTASVTSWNYLTTSSTSLSLRLETYIYVFWHDKHFSNEAEKKNGNNLISFLTTKMFAWLFRMPKTSFDIAIDKSFFIIISLIPITINWNKMKA